MATHPSNANPLLKIASTEAAAKERASVETSTDQREALQALLAFSTLHDQIRRKRVEEVRRQAHESSSADTSWEYEQFVLDEVLQLVAERAQAITGANGIAIALAEGDEIICRASVGEMAPDRGIRLDSKAGFSGACFRTARIVRCDDSERDSRVNLEACRRLGTRSMVAVPLLGQQSVVGLLEAFSTEPFAFNDSDVRSLNLLAELILAALKPEDEDRIVRAAKVAAAELRASELESLRQIPMTPPPSAAEPPKEFVPLEFSKEDIAPSLYEDEGPRHTLGPILAAVGLVAVLIAGGLWWRSSRHASSARNDQGQQAVSSSMSGVSIAAASSSIQAAPPLPAVPVSATATGPSLVSAVRHTNDAGVSTVIIDLQRPVQYRKNRLPNPERIYFDLLDTSLAPGMNGQVIEVKDGLINRIRVAQPAERVTRVVLETKSGSNFWDNQIGRAHV